MSKTRQNDLQQYKRPEWTLAGAILGFVIIIGLIILARVLS